MPKRVLMDQNPTKDNRAKKPAKDNIGLDSLAGDCTDESVASASEHFDWEELRVKSKSKVVLKDASEKKPLLPELDFVKITDLQEMKEAMKPLYEYLMKHFEGLPFVKAGEKQCSYQNCERKPTNKFHRLCDQHYITFFVTFRLCSTEICQKCQLYEINFRCTNFLMQARTPAIGRSF